MYKRQMKFTYLDLSFYLFGYHKIKLLSMKDAQEIEEKEHFPTNNEFHKADYNTQHMQKVTPTYTRLSGLKLPEEISLCSSGLPGARLGICALRVIPVGAWFGPFEGKLVRRDSPIKASDSEQMWEIFHDGEVSHFLDGSGGNSWMSIVKCARHEREQNMVVFQYHGCIYYRTMKEIQCGSELLVWYDSKYIQMFGLPVSWSDNKGNSGRKRQIVSATSFDRAGRPQSQSNEDFKVDEPYVPLSAVPSISSPTVNTSFTLNHLKITAGYNTAHPKEKFHPRALHPYFSPVFSDTQKPRNRESWHRTSQEVPQYSCQQVEAFNGHPHAGHPSLLPTLSLPSTRSSFEVHHTRHSKPNYIVSRIYENAYLHRYHDNEDHRAEKGTN